VIVLNITTSLTFLNAILKGLKQDMSNSCNACDVCDGNVIMSNPKKIACSIAYGVTWLLCPSKTNKCGLLKDTPPKTNLLKYIYKQKNNHPCSFLHCYTNT
jgi:hypothetical protein